MSFYSMLKDMLPKLYWGILSPDFLSLNPQEKLANCESCYKTQSHAPKPHFNSYTKCCTYYPFLPNFLIGGLLLESQALESPNDIIRNRIMTRQYMLPIGACVPSAYQQKFENKSPSDFGNRVDLICDFYRPSNGACDIWKWRGHECATYHCHSSYGKKGEAFWQLVRNFLFELEMFLSQMAMLHLGFESKEIDLNLSYMKGECNASPTWSLAAMLWSKVWAHHFEDIEMYYIQSYEYVLEHTPELKKGWNESRACATGDHIGVLRSLLMGREIQTNH